MSYQAVLKASPISDQSDQFSKSELVSALGRSASATEMITLDIPADLRYVNILGATVCAFVTNIEGLIDREATLYNLELALQEISVNIATHAYATYPGRIRMAVALFYPLWQLTIVLHDTGVAFNPTDVPEPALGELQEHGYGLFLVQQLMDAVEYTPANGENTWKLIKNLPVTENL